MSKQEQYLSEHVEIRRQFLRSVNLEKDYQENRNDGNYIVTPSSRQILRRLAESLSGGSTYRAWTITGPYGVGKSAFAVFLTKLLCRQVAGSRQALKHLEETDQFLVKELGKTVGKGKGMFPIVVTARRVPAALCLLEGIHASLAQFKSVHAKQMIAHCDALLRDARKGIIVDSRRIVSLIDLLSKNVRSIRTNGLRHGHRQTGPCEVG